MSTRKHLNAFQRDEILEYRQQVMFYRKIAEILDVNQNQLARFCKRSLLLRQLRPGEEKSILQNERACTKNASNQKPIIY